MKAAEVEKLARSLDARLRGGFLGKVFRPDPWTLGFEMQGGLTLGFCWEPACLAVGLCAWRWPRGAPEEILVRHLQGALVDGVTRRPGRAHPPHRSLRRHGTGLRVGGHRPLGQHVPARRGRPHPLVGPAPEGAHAQRPHGRALELPRRPAPASSPSRPRRRATRSSRRAQTASSRVSWSGDGERRSPSSTSARRPSRGRSRPWRATAARAPRGSPSSPWPRPCSPRGTSAGGGRRTGESGTTRGILPRRPTSSWIPPRPCGRTPPTSSRRCSGARPAWRSWRSTSRRRGGSWNCCPPGGPNWRRARTWPCSIPAASA